MFGQLVMRVLSNSLSQIFTFVNSSSFGVRQPWRCARWRSSAPQWRPRRSLWPWSCPWSGCATSSLAQCCSGLTYSRINPNATININGLVSTDPSGLFGSLCEAYIASLLVWSLCGTFLLWGLSSLIIGTGLSGAARLPADAAHASGPTPVAAAAHDTAPLVGPERPEGAEGQEQQHQQEEEEQALSSAKGGIVPKPLPFEATGETDCCVKTQDGRNYLQLMRFTTACCAFPWLIFLIICSSWGLSSPYNTGTSNNLNATCARYANTTTASGNTTLTLVIPQELNLAYVGIVISWLVILVFVMWGAVATWVARYRRSEISTIVACQRLAGCADNCASCMHCGDGADDGHGEDNAQSVPEHEHVVSAAGGASHPRSLFGEDAGQRRQAPRFLLAQA